MGGFESKIKAETLSEGVKRLSIGYDLIQLPKVGVLCLNEWRFFLSLASVQPEAEFSQFLSLVVGHRILLLLRLRSQSDEVTDALIIETSINMGEREVSAPTVVTVEDAHSLGLLYDH